MSFLTISTLTISTLNGKIKCNNSKEHVFIYFDNIYMDITMLEFIRGLRVDSSR